MLLTSGVEGIPHLGWIKAVNAIVQASYAAIVVSCFIFSMGNKPRGFVFHCYSFSVLNTLTPRHNQIDPEV